MNMKRLTLPVIILLSLVVLASPSHAISAGDMVKFLPDRILDFTTTSERPAIEDLQKKGGEYHRVQKKYNSKSGRMAVVAIIRGADVAKGIASQFSKGTSLLSMKGFKGVVNPSEQPGLIYSISVRLRDDQMITVVTLNTKNSNIAKEFLNALDLEGLSKLQ